ncbi:hypothetical protein AGMMS49959_17130 [Planctomycetales bacterium]|nr:hypothetical protein AGMMS49959_17130 [Planctomycetales bacterium]
MKIILTVFLWLFIPLRGAWRKIRDRHFLAPLNQSMDFHFQRATILIRNDIAALRLHLRTFGEYKNKFAGKDVALIATGPTLKNFKPIENAVYVGVNRAFKYDKVKMDFLFMADYGGLDYIEDACAYPATKFYGILRQNIFEVNARSPIIPESIAIRHKAKRYYINAVHDCLIQKDLDFVYDITAGALTCYGSIVFPAMQFILWTNPQRIYLVGCDCSAAGQFNDSKPNILGIDCVMRGWRRMKEFATTFYPETEIISVNPVGLKGLFRDIDKE